MRHLKFQKILITLIFVLMVITINAQKSIKLYEYLSLEEFMDIKILNDTNFVKQIYRNVTYPKAAKKNEVEGKIEIILMNHYQGNLEVIILNQPLLFHNLEEEILTALNELNIDQETPFITRFYIIFSLEKPRYPANICMNFHLGLYNNNTFNILDYRTPLIDH